MKELPLEGCLKTPTVSSGRKVLLEAYKNFK
jgi:hypothetical protein